MPWAGLCWVQGSTIKPGNADEGEYENRFASVTVL